MIEKLMDEKIDLRVLSLIHIFTAGTLKTSEQNDASEEFIKFLTSDFGRNAFEETGFKPVAQ